MITKIAFQIVTWAMTLVVIRLLSAEDYGLMAESQLFVNFLSGLAERGLGEALVQQSNTPKPIVSRVFGTLLVTSTALTVLMMLSAYPLADWYDDPRLVALIQVSSLAFLFNSLTAVPRAALTKALRLQSALIIDLVSALIGAAVVIVLAYRGYGVWSLMSGWLATNILKLLGFAVIHSRQYVLPRLGFTGLGPLFSFSLYRTLECAMWMAYISADVVVISRYLSPAALGVYVVALNFVGAPLNKIAPIINQTAFPAFAMLQQRREQAQFYALKALRIMAAIAVPVFFGICATAPEVVDLVFGPKWAEAKSVLPILSLAIVFRAMLLIFPNYLQGIGDSRAGFWCTASGVLIFPPLFVLGCQWGLQGVACAWVVGYPLFFLVHALIASRRGGLQLKAVLMAPIRPVVAGIIMLAAVAATRLLLPSNLTAMSELGIFTIVGATTYCAVLLLVFRTLATEMLRVVHRTPVPAS